MKHQSYLLLLLLFAIFTPNLAIAQSYSYNDLDNSRKVILTCKRITLVDDDLVGDRETIYEIIVEIKQGDAGWMQVSVKNKSTGEFEKDEFQSPKDKCKASETKVNENPNLMYTFTGWNSTTNDQIMSYATFKENNNLIESRHYLMFDENTGHMYVVYNCVFYHDEMGEYAIVQRPFIHTYNPYLHDWYDNLLTSFFRHAFVYYQ